jgi:hypothetical protein
MKMRALSLAACLLLAVASEAAADGFVPTAPWSRYEVLVTRNPYSRHRRRTSEKTDRPAAPRTVRLRLFLKGIAERDGRYMAFFEEFDGRRVEAHVGTRLPVGTVTSMTLDHVILKRNDETVTIAIGAAAEYTPAASAGAEGEGTKPGESADADPAPNGEAAPALPQPAPSDRESLLEQMRRRRRQEIGG